MENLHLKNLDMDKILKKLKPDDDYIDEVDDDFEYDDDDYEWEWTDEDEKEFREFRKYRRRERMLTILIISIPIAIPTILYLILLAATNITR